MQLLTGNTGGKINKVGALNYDGLDKVYDSDEESISFPVSSITVSGLDGDVDEEYFIEWVAEFVSATGAMRIRLNNDSGANYGYQFVRGSSSTISSGRNTARTQLDYDGATVGALTEGKVTLYAKSGNERTLVGHSTATITGTTVTDLNAWGHVWSNTATNITSIVFLTTAGSFTTGTRIVIWKKVSR
jgi:hypothetical protein